MRNHPKPQEIYRHFKGNLYQIITLAEHSESSETMVIYQALYGTFKIYARPLSLFMEKTDKEKYPDARQEYRFVQQREKGSSTEASKAELLKEEQLRGSGSREVPDKSDLSEPREQKKEENTARESERNFPEIDPMLMKFLSAGTVEERLQILTGLRHRITDSMINTMAVSMDLEVADGDTAERYEELRRCLQVMKRFEINR